MERPGAAGPIVVVGAGAAGALAAYFAAGEARRVIVLETTKDGGRKILISGGGRCNVLPSAMRPAQYITSSSPNSLRRLLLSWPLAEQRRFFEETLGIRLVREEETGKLFPAGNRARAVRDTLFEAVTRRGGEFRFEQEVTDIARDGAGWRVRTHTGAAIEAAAVILATGGLSVPNTGSDGFGLRTAQRLGHVVNATYPALTPLTAAPPRHAPLAGISLAVTLTAPLARRSFETAGGFLFTHRGYSGPAVLDISHLAVQSRLQGGPRREILVRWTPLDAEAWSALLQSGGAGTIGGLVRRHLPTRLADALVEESAVPAERLLSELRRDERARVIDRLARYPLPWTNDEGYRKAEVTGGGVALAEVDPRTLESRRAPGLFLCGEMLDAFGPIGGYNFLWAWATGRAAGLGAAGYHATDEQA
jgi:hypothetical protein